MTWTKEQRYLPYDHWDALKLLTLQAQADRSSFQLQYHIRPQSGLLNDPNGFSYFAGQYHLFYQAFPFGPVHGLKSWMHVVSKDLVHWQNLGLAIKPGDPIDSHGAYSGSAQEIDGKLFLMYTGNVRDQNWQRIPYQNGAWMDKTGEITKISQPLFRKPSHISEHFRDPQLLKQNGKYYALLGAQEAQSQTGEIMVYQSTDLVNWEEIGPLNPGPLGYMVECPNLVYVDGRPVLIFCPQGLNKEQASYDNIYPNMYLVLDEVDLAHATVKGAGALQQLDFGFDIYASQAFNRGKDCYLISWAGLPEIAYPTDQENWSGCLSQVKQLHLNNGRLIQRPVAAMRKLRQAETKLANEQILQTATDNQYELLLTIPANQTGTLELAKDNSGSLKVKFDTINGLVKLERTQGDFAKEYGLTRSVKTQAKQELKLDIFIDHSLAEIFVNDGEAVLTSRFFNHGTAIAMTSPCKYTASYWPIVK